MTKEERKARKRANRRLKRQAEAQARIQAAQRTWERPISYYNSKRYADPTAYFAVLNIVRSERVQRAAT